MDDLHLAAGQQRARRMPKQLDRLLAMQDVEQQYAIGLQAEAPGDYIPLFTHYRQACGALARASEHRRLDVERVNRAANGPGDRNRKGAVAAAQLGYIAAAGEIHPLDDPRHIEERLPVRLLGHSTIANLHHAILCGHSIAQTG